MDEFLRGNLPSLTAELKAADKHNVGTVPMEAFQKAVTTIAAGNTTLDVKALAEFAASRGAVVEGGSAVNYFALTADLGKEHQSNKRLAEILKLCNHPVEKTQIAPYRAALAKLQPLEDAQTILKKTGGSMSLEDFQKKFPLAFKESRTVEALLAKEAKEVSTVEVKAPPKICPSILASDFANLSSECKRMIDFGADWLHVDIMDGHFVPNLTIGAPVVKSLRKHTKACLDCHLMVSNPGQWISDFGKAGADTFSFHLEAVEDPNKMIETIVKAGMKPGIALKPDTPIEKVLPYVDKLFLLLVMTVEPGFGGQKFMWWTMPKVAEIRRRFPKIGIQVDGGVKVHTVHACARAGANLIVSGSGIFGVEDPQGVIEHMRKAIVSLV